MPHGSEQGGRCHSRSLASSGRSPEWAEAGGVMNADSDLPCASITVSRLPMADVEQLADDLHVELRAWTATSTQALSDFHLEDLAMMVDNATFNDRIEVRIATLDGRRAGIAVTRAGVHKGEPSTFVWWLAVDPAARRNGVARALVDAIEQDARERLHLLEGKVRADDTAAVSFWTALGWRPAGPGPKASWIGRTSTPRRR